MDRNEKINLLNDYMKNGKHGEAFKEIAERQLQDRVRFAIDLCKLPLLKYLAHRLGEPEEKLELFTELEQGIRKCNDEEDIRSFIEHFEQKHREEIVGYLQKEEEYWNNKFRKK